MNRDIGIFAFALVVTPSTLIGCESTVPAQSPADRAASVERSYCTADFSESVVAQVLDGSTIERVEPAYQGSASRGSNPRLQGAAIVVRPVQGETAEWLNRALECHGAHQLVAHAKGTTVRADPFWLEDSIVNIEVTSARDGFRIRVTGESSADAREILARAQALPRPENATAVFDAR